MPRIPETLKSKMISVMKSFPKEFAVDNNGLYCLMCSKTITYDEKHGNYLVTKHRKTDIHQKNLTLSKPQLLTTSIQDMEQINYIYGLDKNVFTS